MNEQDWTVGRSDVDARPVDEEIVERSDAAPVDGVEGADDSILEDVLVLEVVDDALVLPVWEPTGVARVDAALDELTRLDPDDVHHHAEVYDAIHQRLRGTLSDLDTPV